MSETPPLSDRQEAARRPAITLRSVLLGFTGVLIINLLTPYNDYALNNTTFIGTNLPLGLVMLGFLFIVLVNAPLNRYAPRWAFNSGELTVAFALALVSCALPSSGLMRYLPPSMVAPYWHASTNPNHRAVLDALDLPNWIRPTFESDDIDERIIDPIVADYYGRTGEGAVPPYRAWVRPALMWAIFVFALYGAILCMVTLVRRQWHENERLAFPLAQIQLALVEQPARGRFLNSMLSSRAFWIAFATIFFLRAWNGVHEYWPRYFEQIPLGFDLEELFSEGPLVYVASSFYQADLFFIVVGVTFFLSTPVAFSLWFFYVLVQVYRVMQGMSTGDPEIRGTWDQHFGAVIAFTLVIFWVGRRHWWMILRHAVGQRREGEEYGRYLPYPFAFWGMVCCALVMMGWLVAAGCSYIGAIVIVLLLLLLFMIVTRIIAETGLVYGQMLVPIYRPWELLAIYGWSKPVDLNTFYLSGVIQNNFYDFREPSSVYASHGLKLADQTIYQNRDEEDRRGRRTGMMLIGLLMLALVVGYFVSFSSTLWTKYNYASTLDRAETHTPINPWGSVGAPRNYQMNPSHRYETGGYQERHSPLGHMGGGFTVTGVLSYLRLRFTWWPLHPIGYLMYPTTPFRLMWFSIMLGWLCKVMIVRFGGASLYQNAKPFFLGLIVGEAVVAGFWLVTNIVLNAMNVPYQPINFMPI